MKILILLLSFAWINSSGQIAMASVRRVTPKNVCPGDSIKIDFMFGQPAGGNTLTTVYFTAYQPLATLWQGSYLQFYSMPKEHLASYGPTDSCVYMWVKIPLNYPAGTHSVMSNLPGQDNDFTITLPNITIPTHTVCLGQPFYFNPSGAISYTYSSGNMIIHPSVTNTYVISGTGASGCVASKTVTVNVIDCTVGIEEYELNETSKTYYDLQGNKTEKLYNTLIIEQSGNTRRKIIFTTM